MEGLVGSRFDVANAVRKKRSNTSRRPRPDTPTVFDNRDCSPSSSTPPSDSVSNVSSDKNAVCNAGFRRKEINLNSSALRHSSFNRAGDETFPKKFKKDDGTFGEIDAFYRKNSSRGGSSTRYEQVSDFKRCSEGVLAPANWKSTSTVKDGFESQFRNPSSNSGNGRNGDNRSSGQSGVSSSGMGNKGDSSSHENKLRKVKLKVGGVTHTIHAKSTSDSASGGPYMKSSRSSDVPRQRQKLILQDNSDSELSPPDQMNELQGIPWKDIHGGRFSHKSKEDSRGRMSQTYVPEKQNHGREPSSEPVRKSKRVPKRRVLDGAFDDADEDDEIRYLERLKNAKSSMDYGTEFGDNGEESNNKLKTSKVSKRKMAGGEYDDAEEYGLSWTNKEGKKKSRPGRDFDDTDYIEDDDDDELGLDVGFEAKRKKQRKEYVDSLIDSKKEISLTMRQRALQSGKDVSAGSNASLIEFPNGLPPAPPRKQKEKPSEVEQQLKKAEAAQRRRMQNEKAALESQKEAIRKILGQDSSRKKREDKLRKRRDELAQEKAANAMMLESNTVRWIMGPTGTTVTFPKDVGLPSIFDSKPCSYPPPREKCAGPSCMNAYKYRDSKLKIPLCSLQCYRAIHEMMQPVTTC